MKEPAAPATLLVEVSRMWSAARASRAAESAIETENVRERAVIAGGVLFVLGGLVPLLISSSMPIELRAASLAEILFQRFPRAS